MFVYLAVSESAISAAIIQEEDGIQRPVYFNSKALQGSEQNYPRMEKLAYAQIHASRKMKPYFQAHSMVVLTDSPLRQVLHKPEKFGRLMT